MRRHWPEQNDNNHRIHEPLITSFHHIKCLHLILRGYEIRKQFLNHALLWKWTSNTMAVSKNKNWRTQKKDGHLQNFHPPIFPSLQHYFYWKTIITQSVFPKPKPNSGPGEEKCHTKTLTSRLCNCWINYFQFLQNNFQHKFKNFPFSAWVILFLRLSEIIFFLWAFLQQRYCGADYISLPAI